MRLVTPGLLLLCGLFASASVAAATLPAEYVEQSPDGLLQAWHATLDLRRLPPETRPASVGVTIDAREAVQQDGSVRVAVALNGVVIGRARAEPHRPTPLTFAIEDRLLSTRNHVSVAVTSTEQSCSGSDCTISRARLDGGFRIALAPATGLPVSFAQHATRFRAGVAIEADNPHDWALGELAAQALAPQAPHRPDGPARIVVSRAAPPGTSPPLRFDTGPVELKDRDGNVIYDQAALDRLTVVQVLTRGDTPILWMRPGSDMRPVGPIELDHGTVALFGRAGREIAFAPEQDHAVAVAYAADAQREARFGLYWRLGILAVWLAATAGLLIILRRLPPLQAGTA